jgi:hypothetical protein
MIKNKYTYKIKWQQEATGLDLEAKALNMPCLSNSQRPNKEEAASQPQ